MKSQYAHVVDNVVIGIYQFDSKVINPEYIEINDATNVDTSYVYDASTSVFSELVISPVVPPSDEVDSHITRLAFLSRFTTVELVGIDLAGIGETVAAASVRTFMLKVKSASYIDLSRLDTKEGVLNLVGINLLTDVRADEILNTPIEEVERPL